LCILGRQPVLGLAELESLYGGEHLRPLGDNALLDIDAGEINFKRLGGTIKVARILAEIDSTDWTGITKYLLKNVPPHLQHLPEGKFTLGLSAYDLKTDVESINRTGLAIKKIIRKSGRPVRVVPNKALALNSAQVLHNKLTHLGAWELLLVARGDKTLLAQTMFVQDIDAYAARDQARPRRDSRVGMLPPKLAQIIINLAAGAPGSFTDHADDKKAMARWNILDPFCGSGVILQEALLMGYSVTGSDLDERMVAYSKENVSWLIEKNPNIEGRVVLEVADAATAKWPPFSVVASETALGPPLSSLPLPDKFKSLVSETNLIIKKFLKNLQPQLRPERKICIAVPAWRDSNNKLIDLPLIDQISDLGYNWVDFQHMERADLVYFREDQTVARRLLVLEKK
jgi:tRNA G10  N-methylase Trm11